MYRKGRDVFFRLGILGLLPLLSGCNVALLDPKGWIGESEKTLILTSFALMLLVVVPVIFMALFFAYKYRASNTKADYKPDWAHSTKIEAVVWSVPCLIVISLGLICWRSTHDLDPARPLEPVDKTIEIDVVALDWKWVFIYPEQQIAVVNQVAFPVNTPVRFVITSDSVMNSFFIPQLGSQIYAMSGMRAKLHLIAHTEGVYDGGSANFSGNGFSGMKFQTLVKSPGDFEAWVEKVRQSSDVLDATTYPALAKTSENNPVAYYGVTDPALFDGIVDKYMGMVMDKDQPDQQPSHEAGEHDVR